MGSHEFKLEGGAGYKGYSVVSLPNQHPQIAQLKDGRSEPTTGLFEDAALFLITVSHTCLGKLTSLPFPVGTIVEAVEELVVPIAHPIEGLTLRILSAIDDQIYAVGMSIKGSIASTSEQANWVLIDLRKRGLLGMSADFWVQHESSMRERVQRIIELLNKIRLVGVATPCVCAISAPLVNAVSNWLLEHSQLQDKTIQFHLKEGEWNGGREKLDKMEEKLEETVQLKDDVKADEIESKAMNTKKDEEGPRLSNEGKGERVKASEERNHVTVDKKDEVVNANKKTEDASDVIAVLEMIESGWLLGSGGAVSPRMHAATSSPKSPSIPKKHANSKSKRGLSRH